MSWMPRRLMLLLACSVLLLAPLLTVQLTTGSGRAYACNCAELPTLSEAFEDASAVFSGKITLDGGHYVWIQVDMVWKGSIASTAVVAVPSTCGYPSFERGTDYLVYAVGDDDSLWVYMCSGTGRLESVQHDLRALGEGRAPESGIAAAMPTSEDEEQNPGGTTTVDSPPRYSLRSLAWWAPLLAGIAAAALIFRRWAGRREPE